MAQQGENIIKCELSAVIDQLCLNQMEMVSRAKQSNEILKNLYATITELRAENNSLRNEVLQLRSREFILEDQSKHKSFLILIVLSDRMKILMRNLMKRRK